MSDKKPETVIIPFSEKVPGAAIPYCCVPVCQAPAEWNIYREGDPPHDWTQACEAHVGSLLVDGYHQVWPVV